MPYLVRRTMDEEACTEGGNGVIGSRVKMPKAAGDIPSELVLMRSAVSSKRCH
jgi:hypothetical protein